MRTNWKFVAAGALLFVGIGGFAIGWFLRSPGQVGAQSPTGLRVPATRTHGAPPPGSITSTEQAAAKPVKPSPEDQKRAEELHETAINLMREGFPAAAQWAEQYALEPYAVNVVADVADEWASHSPLEAIQWALDLPEGEAQNRSVAAAFLIWSRKDPVAASQFLDEMDSSPLKDRAIDSFVLVVAPRDPEAAALWASSITDPERRERAMIRAGQTWFGKDRMAARQWASRSGVPPESLQNMVVATSPPKKPAGVPAMSGTFRRTPAGTP